MQTGGQGDRQAPAKDAVAQYTTNEVGSRLPRCLLLAEVDAGPGKERRGSVDTNTGTG